MQKIHEKNLRYHDCCECKSLVQNAINRCSVSSIQNYIKRNYTKNTEKWALWARQHSPLLLQVTSTNPLESFYSELKRLTSSKHGLIGKSRLLWFHPVFLFNSFHSLFFFVLFSVYSFY